MYIRCADCKASTRATLGPPGSKIQCDGCGRTYGLERAGDLGSTPHERYERALSHAEEHEIDLASAYSVLLGIMSLETARAIREAPAAASPADGATTGRATGDPGPASGPDPSESQKAAVYDRAFQKAIDEGFLTVQQAASRGDRVMAASSLARRHDLPMKLAFMVTDNRLRLVEALREKADDEQKEKEAAREPGRALSGRRGRWIPALAVVALIAVGLFAWATRSLGEPRPPDPGPKTRSARRAAPLPVLKIAAEVRTNPAGRVTEVTGPDPMSVLFAYCHSGTVQGEPVRVGASSDASTGFFRRDGELLKITIRKDSVKNAWVAGNGKDPIEISRL